jgi:ribosome biogenesis GTPase A
MNTMAEHLSKLGVEKINWFPGHMHRALKLMNDYVKNVDLFLEIRDSRVPISSKNDEFDHLIVKH